MEGIAHTKYTVRAGGYEGPFEVLLDLIQERKLLVNELSLAQVTDDFIAHVRGKGEFPMEEAAHFIAIAATLLLIKSKSLIPELELSEDEEEDMEDLKRRLAAYERVREAARELSRVFGKNVMVSRGERAPEPVFAPSRDLSQESLQKALVEALSALEKQEELPEARIRSIVTIEEMMDRLTDRVQRALKLSFKEFSGSVSERVEVIVSFLALLELVKQGIVEVSQPAAFSDITISNLSASVPQYGG